MIPLNCNCTLIFACAAHPGSHLLHPNELLITIHHSLPGACFVDIWGSVTWILP